MSDGLRHPRNIIKFNHDNDKLHPTQKPVALIEYLIKTYTNDGETVLDFTMGSGTTGVSCKNLNRNFIGMQDLSIKVAPFNNRIAVDHLMWSIVEAAQRAKEKQN